MVSTSRVLDQQHDADEHEHLLVDEHDVTDHDYDVADDHEHDDVDIDIYHVAGGMRASPAGRLSARRSGAIGARAEGPDPGRQGPVQVEVAEQHGDAEGSLRESPRQHRLRPVRVRHTGGRPTLMFSDSVRADGRCDGKPCWKEKEKGRCT